MMRIKVPLPFRLYRCDTSEPSSYWDETMTYKTNYGTKYGELGPKNKAGLFFFHDHVDMSHSYAKGLKTLEIEFKDLDVYYITEACLNDTLSILDFSKDHSTFLMIETLINNGLILPESMVNHNNENQPLASLCQLYNDYKATGNWKIPLHIKVSKCDNEIDASYFGQLLTDFENGPIFKEMLIEQGFDGYRWREHNDPRGLTYCLIDPTKLNPPVSSSFNF